MLAEQKLDALEKGFDSFETRMNQHASLTRDLVIGIAVAMFITTVIIIIDYAHNRGDGYLKYIDKVDELQEGYYSKAEIDSIFNDYVSCKDVDGYHKCK
jgi:hypothetical protein